MTKSRESRSDLEELLAFQLKAAGLRLEREYRFHPQRQWRFDFASPTKRLAVEVEGVAFKGHGKAAHLDGRHVRPKGFEEDAAKYAEAAILGWRVLRVTGRMVKRGQALAYVERALGEGR